MGHKRQAKTITDRCSRSCRQGRYCLSLCIWQPAGTGTKGAQSSASCRGMPLFRLNHRASHFGIADAQRRESESRSLVHYLSENGACGRLIGDGARNSTFRELASVPLFDGLQFDTRELIALEVTFGHDALKRERVREGGLVERRGEVIFRRLLGILPCVAQQLPIARKQIVRQQ